MTEPEPKALATVGGPIEWWKVAIELWGSDLIPEEITALMGREPDEAYQKGHPIPRSKQALLVANNRPPPIAKRGCWSAQVRFREADEKDWAEVARRILATLPADPALWRALAARFEVTLWVTFGLQNANQGFGFPPDLLQYVGERGIASYFNIYGETF